MRSMLWTRNFIFAVSGMVISAFGGIGLSVALGVIVFQETQSTMMTAIFAALTLIPQLVLPLVIGPLIDRRNPLKVMLTSEGVLACLFLITGVITRIYGFSYMLYTVFAFVISSIGVIPQLASQSILPQIMAQENYVRGNAIINIIYPLASVVITPIALLVYDKYGMSTILFAYTVACVLDVLLESRIKADFEFIQAAKTTIKEYAGDLKDAFGYIAKDPAIRSIFLLFTLVMLSASSYDVLDYPFFDRSDVLTLSDYAVLSTISSAGYLLGGLMHYFIRIPSSKRFTVALIVYFIFVALDAPFFLMPFWLMCAVRFLLGILGMNSANIRVSAIQVHVPNTMRAKVNALFGVLTSGAMLLGQLIVGALGEYLPYWAIQMGFQSYYLFGILFFFLPRKNRTRELYNYSTTLSGETQNLKVQNL